LNIRLQENLDEVITKDKSTVTGGKTYHFLKLRTAYKTVATVNVYLLQSTRKLDIQVKLANGET
jgi:hypothetical protein